MILYSRREGGERGEDFFMLLIFFLLFHSNEPKSRAGIGIFCRFPGSMFLGEKEGTEGVARK